MINWTFLPWDQLDRQDIYDLFAARMAVFVVEQNCVYQDFDGKDPGARHLLGRGPDGKLAGYARILQPGAHFEEPSIGRILTTAAYRGQGVGRMLVKRAIDICQHDYPGQTVRIGAQRYLEEFYGEAGFEPVGPPYIEDGIPHIEMLLKVDASAKDEP